jgi:hypothetical protein
MKNARARHTERLEVGTPIRIAKAQLSLFDNAPSLIRTPVTLKDQFREFDQKFPVVYEKFRSFAVSLLEQGRTRYSARTILERVRWDVNLSVSDGEFKLNNNLTPFFARKLIGEDARFANFFELRALKGERGTP